MTCMHCHEPAAAYRAVYGQADYVRTVCAACAPEFVEDGATLFALDGGVEYVPSAPSAVTDGAPASLMVCIDCVQWIAGIDDHERGSEYPSAVVDAMTDDDALGWLLVNSCADDCADSCRTFTGAPCDTCASWLAGERHAVTGLTR